MNAEQQTVGREDFFIFDLAFYQAAFVISYMSNLRFGVPKILKAFSAGILTSDHRSWNHYWKHSQYFPKCGTSVTVWDLLPWEQRSCFQSSFFIHIEHGFVGAAEGTAAIAAGSCLKSEELAVNIMS